MEPRKLYNSSKYLSTEIISECFTTAEINFVDKVLTGNGFTTGFSRLQPPDGKVNVLIAPNQAVVKDKEQDHQQGNFGFQDSKVAFVYEGHGLHGDPLNYDLLVFVADSFLLNRSNLTGKIDKLLVDEYHTIEIQSSFRHKLKRLMFTLREDFCDVAISYLTATPNLCSPTDIQIINENIPERLLMICNNPLESIKRVVESIKKGKPVLIFTHEARVVQHILEMAGRKDFRLTAAVHFKTTLLSKAKYHLDTESNIHIITSSGFEGWSDFSLNPHVYIFINIAHAHTTFYGSNIYQAIGRARKGYEYAEVCVRNVNESGFENKPITSLTEKAQKLMESTEYSIEQKQNSSTKLSLQGKSFYARELKPFFFFHTSKEKALMEIFQPAIGMNAELSKYHLSLSQYSMLFKQRNITTRNITNHNDQKLPKKIVSKTERVNNIVHSILKNRCEDLFFDFFFKRPFRRNKKVSDYINNRNALLYYQKESFLLLQAASLSELKLRPIFKALSNFYKSPDLFDKLDEIRSISVQKKRMTTREERESKRSFKSSGFINCLTIATELVLKRTTHRIVGFRDYNYFTTVSLEQINFIVSSLGLSMHECDIKNAFPRILYALCGLSLPVDFYGLDSRERNKRKKRINTTLNSFFFDTKKKSSKADQKKNARNRLAAQNFHPEVVDYLINQWFESPFKGSLFNFLACHEKEIITGLIREVKESNNGLDLHVVRRHDSFLLFYDENSFISLEFINDYKYLGIPGFFDRQENISSPENSYSIEDLNR